MFQELYRWKSDAIQTNQIHKVFPRDPEKLCIASIDLGNDCAEVFSCQLPLVPEICHSERPMPQPEQPSQPAQMHAGFRGLDEVETLAWQMVSRGVMIEEVESDKEIGGWH